jgi:carbonic anhydrase/acetyltransferase-like protein (isoleucine patch superfamily)
MLIEHRGKRPRIDPSAYVAPTAVVCGDVTVGPECCVLFGAVITAEDGAVVLGTRCIVMEHALVRGRAAHRVQIGDNVLVGPHAHLNGCVIADDVFVATGASVFPGAQIGVRAEVRINGVVHVNTVVAPDGLVPIGRARSNLGHPEAARLSSNSLRSAAAAGRRRDPAGGDAALRRMARCAPRRPHTRLEEHSPDPSSGVSIREEPCTRPLANSVPKPVPIPADLR